jgi:competence ComEA-like helix-hairpin-helix protein
MDLKSLAKDFFSFSRKDRIGAISLVVVIAVFTFIPVFLARFISKTPVLPDSPLATAEKKMEAKKDSLKSARRYFNPKSAYHDQAKTELFYFDPNTLEEPGWRQLGVRDKTIATIFKFKSKGGRFRTPADIEKIYGLRKTDIERLLPYVRIMGDSTITKKPTTGFVRKTLVIDINSADSFAFVALPGIGNKLASRIILFREKLGGFYSIDQVKEVYGLADSVFQQIKSSLILTNAEVKKININDVTIDELKQHPYIRWSLANPIISYRNEHGPFKNLNDLKNIMAITEEIFQKIEPYLTLQ